MKAFDTYLDAAIFARSYAREHKQPMGIEKPTAYESKWIVRMLPLKQNRYGWELRCEAVEP